MIDKNEFAFRLRMAMKEKMVTGTKLAAECGVTKASAYHWMHGSNLPSEENMRIVAKFLNVDISWLKGRGMYKELKKNAEGYTDPTAYKAMKNVLEGERKMYECGQIYTFYWNESETKPMVVVSERNHAKHFIGIVLMDSPETPLSVPVCIDEKNFYAEPGRVSYTYKNKVGEYMCDATAEEIKKIQEGIADVLGIATPVGIEKLMNERMELGLTVVDLEKELEEKRADIEFMDAMVSGLKERIGYLEQNQKPAPTDDVIRLQTERDIYKAQYEMLFERMMAR